MKTPITYEGQLKYNYLTAWTVAKAGNPVSYVRTVEQLEFYTTSSNLTVVFFGKKDKNYTAFEKAIHGIPGPLYLHTDAPESIQEFNATSPSIALFKSYDDKKKQFHRDLEIRKFLNDNKIPWTMPLDSQAKQYIFDQNQNCLLLLRHNSEHSKFIKRLQFLGKNLRSEICFAYTDITSPEEKQVASLLGVEPSQ